MIRLAAADSHSDDRLGRWIFLFAFCYALVFQSSALETFDEQIYFHAAWSVTERGLPSVDSRYDPFFITLGRDGNIYPKFAPGQSYLLAPFVALARVSHHLFGGNDFTWCRIFFGVYGALTMGVLARAGYGIWRLLGYTARAGAWSAIFLVAATECLPQSRTLQSNLSCMALFWMAFYLVLKVRHARASMDVSERVRSSGVPAAGLAGLCLGGSVLIRPDSALFLPVFLLMMVCFWIYPESNRSRFKLPALAVACASVPVLFLLIHQYRLYGDSFQSGYGREAYQFTTPLWVGLEFLLFDRDKGWLVTNPIIVLMAYPWYLFYKRRPMEAIIGAGMPLVYLWIYSSWYTNQPGMDFTYGQRFLLPALPFLMLPLAEFFSGGMNTAYRRLGFAALAVSCLAQILVCMQFSGDFMRWRAELGVDADLPMRIWLHITRSWADPGSIDLWWVQWGILARAAAVIAAATALLALGKLSGLLGTPDGAPHSFDDGQNEKRPLDSGS